MYTEAMSTTNTPADAGMTSQAVSTTELPLPNKRQGKVRDIYDVPTDEGTKLLIVATDRISAFDVILPNPIPGKGVLLTTLSARWFDYLRNTDTIGDHVLSLDPEDVPGLDAQQREQLRGRMMLCRPARVVPIECVARGYLAGSGWAEYQKSGTVCGIELPSGLQLSDKLPEVIFTPATKATEGHDENISFEVACDLVGTELMQRLRDLTISIYSDASDYARERGLILADTKFEFGMALDKDGNPTDELMIIDEVLTPDSSRYWPADDYEPGREQASFDKQYVRNYLQELVDKGEWDKTPPGPSLPEHIITNTLARYSEAIDRLS